MADRHPQRHRGARRRGALVAARKRTDPVGGPQAVASAAARLSGPVRTCVGCRERSTKATLLRVVADGDRLVPDPGGRLPGRGASVHPNPRCIDLAEKRRAFPRALRLAGPLDDSLLRETARESVQDRQQASLQRADLP